MLGNQRGAGHYECDESSKEMSQIGGELTHAWLLYWSLSPWNGTRTGSGVRGPVGGPLERV